jgi:hypothetical protein
MSHPDAALIGVPTGCSTMLVAISVEAPAMAWLARSVGRFPATRVHATPGGGYEFVNRMPLPPYPIIGCPREPHNWLAPGIAVTGQGGFIIWPAPRGYEHCCPGYRVTADLSVAPLPLWVVRKVTAPTPRPAVPVAFRTPRRGLDVQLDRLGSFIRYSRQRTLDERTVGAGRAAGQLVAQGWLAERAAVDVVTAAAVEAGLSSREAQRAARRGAGSGRADGDRFQRIDEAGAPQTSDLWNDAISRRDADHGRHDRRRRVACLSPATVTSAAAR